MSAESVKENAIRKVIQELIVPDLQKLISKVEILDERITSVRTELKSDISSLEKELKSDINRLENKIEDNEEKMDIKISALSEKVDLMNKFNDKLFDALHPTNKWIYI